MAFHIPFNQRASLDTQAPIYIGFNSTARNRRRNFNWWGFHGMWLSFFSLLSVGFLSLIPLLISLVGLRRPGRKMALVGTMVSLLGIGLASTILFGSISHHRHRVAQRHAMAQQVQLDQQQKQTAGLLELASSELTEYRDHHEGELPTDIDANMLVIKHVDPWGESLRYDAEQDQLALVRSAGQDRIFDTHDDVTSKVTGKTGRQRLLPVE